MSVTDLEVAALNDVLKSIVDGHDTLTSQLGKIQFGMLGVMPSSERVDFHSSRGAESLDLNDLSALRPLEVIISLLENQMRSLNPKAPEKTDKLHIYSLAHCLELVVIMLTDSHNPSLNVIRTSCIKGNLLLNKIKLHYNS